MHYFKLVGITDIPEKYISGTRALPDVPNKLLMSKLGMEGGYMSKYQTTVLEYTGKDKKKSLRFFCLF